MPNENDAVALVQGIQANMDEMKKTNAQVLAELRNTVDANGKDAKAAIELADGLAKKIQAGAENILALEQKLSEKVIAGKAPVQSLGQMVIKSDAFKQYAAGGSTRMRVEANTIIGQDGSPLENSGVIVAPQRLPGIIPGSYRALKVRDLLPAGNTTSNAIEYTRELAFTNNAAETGEGATKPQSDLTFELVTANVRTIAHWIKASKQVLDDAPALQSYIDTRLRYGVENRIDSQLLNGDGTGQNISGLRDAGNFTPNTPLTGDTALDTINRAIYAVLGADYAATGIIMNPADWGAIERLKDSQQRYIIGNPLGGISAVLWGLPVAVTNAMPAGQFQVGAYDIAAQVWNRQGTIVEMFEQDDVNVQKNLLTIRAEARATLAIYLPASLRGGALTV